MAKNFLKITKGDIDGLLGLLADNLAVFLVLISLNLYVVGMPAEIVFWRILPGAAIGLLVANLYYTYMAVKLAKKENRDDVTALPSGISIIFVITYTFGILLPAAKITGDPEMAWRIGIAANLIGAAICVLGALIGTTIRRFLPTVSMLGPIAGLAVVFVAGGGLRDVFTNPLIGFAALAIILWGYIAKGKLPFKLPTGLLALLVGSLMAVFMGQTVVDMTSTGAHLPRFWIFKIGAQAFKDCLPFLAIIIPVAVINFIATLNNVESAASVGDRYNIKEAMLADAAASAVSAVFGCCYPNCVFIGHPAYKRMQAKRTYSLLCGIILTILSLFGLFGLVNSIIPLAAVSAIFVFVGIVNIEVAFTVIPRLHIPAAALAILPFISEFSKEQIDVGLAAVGVALPLSQELINSLKTQGINYQGLTTMAHGTIILSMLLSALMVFTIERKMFKASIIAFIGAICSFVGLIHSPQLVLNSNPQLDAAWAMIAIVTLLAGIYLQKKNNNNNNIDNKDIIDNTDNIDNIDKCA